MHRDKEKILELLVRSLDEDLSLEEYQVLDEALSDSEELRTKKAELQKLRLLLSEQKEEASLSFVNKVLEKTLETSNSVQKGFQSTLVYLFPRVAAALVILMLGSLLSIYVSEGNLSSEAIVGVADIYPEEAYTILVEE